MIDHFKETAPGVVGNCASGVAFGVAWITVNIDPVLHTLAIAFGVLASAATATYYITMWRGARAERARRSSVRRVARNRMKKKGRK